MYIHRCIMHIILPIWIHRPVAVRAASVLRSKYFAASVARRVVARCARLRICECTSTGVESPIRACREPSHRLMIDANLCGHRSAHGGSSIEVDATHDTPPAVAVITQLQPTDLQLADRCGAKRTDRVTVRPSVRCCRRRR